MAGCQRPADSIGWACARASVSGSWEEAGPETEAGEPWMAGAQPRNGVRDPKGKLVRRMKQVRPSMSPEARTDAGGGPRVSAPHRRPALVGRSDMFWGEAVDPAALRHQAVFHSSRPPASPGSAARKNDTP